MSLCWSISKYINVLAPNQFLLMSLDGILYPVIVEEARLKPGLVATHKGPVRNMSKLKKAAQLMYTNNHMFLMYPDPNFYCMLF